MTALTFVVPGPPVPCARARVYRDRRTGKTRGFTPDKTRAYESRVGICARAAAARARWAPDAGAEYVVRIAIFREARRGDFDNFTKAITDGMKGIAWVDDRQIVEAHITMHVDRAHPRAEVTVERTAA